MTNSPFPPVAVIDGQLQAYNAHDIDGFLAYYSEDIEIYDFPSTLKVKGIAQMRELYGPYMADKDLHGQVFNRFVMGAIVVDLERATVNLPSGLSVLDAIAIYEIHDDKIKKLTIIYDKPAVAATLGAN